MDGVRLVVREVLGPPHDLSWLTLAGYWVCLQCGYIARYAMPRPLTCPNENAVIREVPWQR